MRGRRYSESRSQGILKSRKGEKKGKRAGKFHTWGLKRTGLLKQKDKQRWKTWRGVYHPSFSSRGNSEFRTNRARFTVRKRSAGKSIGDRKSGPGGSRGGYCGWKGENKGISKHFISLCLRWTEFFQKHKYIARPVKGVRKKKVSLGPSSTEKGRGEMGRL